MNAKNIFLEFVETALSSIVVLMVIYISVALPEMVWGSSMEPNFYSEDRIIVDRITPKFQETLSRGELVVFAPKDSSKHLIKRVIGLPGDVFKIFECKIYIARENERFVLEEDYLPKEVCTKGGPTITEGRAQKLGEDEYIVLGDNRAVSMDSRVLGPISKKDVVGKVVFRFWPISKIGFVR